MTVAEYNSCADLYSDGVYRFILKNIKDDDTANDIVQESYVRLWERVKDISFEKAKAYLFTTAYHTMIDHIRRNKRYSEMDGTYDTELQSNNAFSDLKEVIDEAVAKLPEIQRTVILLRDYEGYAYDEIGEITGLNESQVKVYIFRARTFLKQYIGKLDLVI
ncbi:MAG TPA: RNA polymerase sigma factor [Bacteroidales bacterium]|nr:RNA polymerase sigma factor [Bacteroidales bacterium]HPT02103.1 RNA polymerase sigma factor [Bacteroidales bacterium]